MKELIFNEDNVKDTEINAVVTRVKVLMLNSENKILLGYCDGIYQFPGGHVEEGEALNVTVRREIKEETGIELDTTNMIPFYCIKHYKRKYDGTNICALSQLYYFLVKTDEKINVENIKYTEREKRGGYRLEYVSLEKLEKTLKDNIPNNIHNATIVKEMLAVIDESGIMCGERNIKFNSLIPELSVLNINTTLEFYKNLGFEVKYERKEDKFYFVQLEGNQIMLEEINDNWNTGKLEYPFGRGINISMTVRDIDAFYWKIKAKGLELFRELKVSEYRVDDVVYEDKEFLIQDPDGYLLRFNN